MTTHEAILFGAVLTVGGLVLYRYCPEFIATMAKLDALVGHRTTATEEPSAGEILLIRGLIALVIILGMIIAAVGLVRSG